MRYLHPIENCKLCEWRCGVDRLAGEPGVCQLGIPMVASSTLHPAPPASYDAFMAGCNFKCLSCQNWTISQSKGIGDYYEPKEWARIALSKIDSIQGKLIKADRIFFTGGEPTCSLPWCEEVVKEARKIDPGVKVNFDTNGFMTEDTLRRVLKFTNSITFDIKAYSEDVHRSLTGAPSGPVLRNAEYIAREAKEKLWEFRALVIPGISDEEVEPISQFIADIDPNLPVCLLAFRPNFVLENHPGATSKLMQESTNIARKAGLRNVKWSGIPNIPGRGAKDVTQYLSDIGCTSDPRDCGSCEKNQNCPIHEP